jgi:hypothetical protein
MTLSAALTRLAGTVAVALVALATVVARAVDPKNNMPPETKLVPVALSVKSLDPAAIDDGESDVSVGTGFGVATTTGTVVALVPPPGGGFLTPI